MLLLGYMAKKNVVSNRMSHWARSVKDHYLRIQTLTEPAMRPEDFGELTHKTQQFIDYLREMSRRYGPNAQVDQPEPEI